MRPVVCVSVDLHILNGLALFGALTAILFYHFAECRRKIRLLFALWLYWGACAGISALRCYAFVRERESSETVGGGVGGAQCWEGGAPDARFVLVGILISIYAALFLLDLWILVKTVSLSLLCLSINFLNA